MPIYEYRCRENGHEFEVIQKFSDEPLETCRECGAPVDKLISASAFVLKGSGFYVNDYARKGKPDDKKAESKTESNSESKSDTKSDTSGKSSTPSKASAA